MQQQLGTRVGRSLRFRLMVSFCLAAIVPAFLVLALQVHDGEQRLQEIVALLAHHEDDAIHATGSEITRVSLATLDTTNQRLIDLSQAEIDRLSQALNGLNQQQLRQASQQVIDLGQATNQQLTREMVQLDDKALARLVEDLKRLDVESNVELSRATSEQAATVLHEHTQRLIAYDEALGRNLANYLAGANRGATAQISGELKDELRREPLVNFRQLAQVMAQSFAGSSAMGEQGASVTLVNRNGEVVASTRYKREQPLANLEIVRRALHDDAGLAATRPLVTYTDGARRFMGVYDRRPTGGAVIVSYSVDLAEADVHQIEGLVDRSLATLTTTTTRGTAEAIGANTPRIQKQADRLSLDSRRVLQQEVARGGRDEAAKMTAYARNVAHEAEARMNSQAKLLSDRAVEAMHGKAQANLEQAVDLAAVLGERSAIRARSTMLYHAHAATGDVAQQVQPRIRSIGERAAGQIPAQIADAIADSRRQTALTSLALLLLALLGGLGASYWLSTSIADPIEVEKRLKQAALERFGQEMEIATRIQTALLPRDLAVAGFELAIGAVAATEVGGDLVDYIPRADGGFWLAIGDVTGHGLTPGLVMMMAQSLLTGFVLDRPQDSPRAVLARINRALHQNVRHRMDNDNFMTLQLLRHEGDGCFVVAGLHCDLLIHRAQTGAVERLHVDGCWIGLVPEVEDLLQEAHFTLEPGDTLVLYTDGVIEAGNAGNEQYDVRRLEQVLGANAAASPAELKDLVLASVGSWMQTQTDDVSLIVLRRG